MYLKTLKSDFAATKNPPLRVLFFFVFLILNLFHSETLLNLSGSNRVFHCETTSWGTVLGIKLVEAFLYLQGLQRFSPAPCLQLPGHLTDLLTYLP